MNIYLSDLLDIISKHCDANISANILNDLEQLDGFDYSDILDEYDLNDVLQNDTLRKVIGPIYLKKSAIEDLLDAKADFSDPIYKDESIRQHLEEEALAWNDDAEMIQTILESNLVDADVQFDSPDGAHSQSEPHVRCGPESTFNCILSAKTTNMLIDRFAHLSRWYCIVDNGREQVYVKDINGIHDYIRTDLGYHPSKSDLQNWMFGGDIQTYEMDKFFDENPEFTLMDFADFIAPYIRV